jgi:hypothetical protein
MILIFGDFFHTVPHSQVETFPSAPCCQPPSFYVPPVIWEAARHSFRQQTEKQKVIQRMAVTAPWIQSAVGWCRKSLCLFTTLEYVLRSWGIAPCTSNFGMGWKWVVTFIIWPVYPRRNTSRNWRGGSRDDLDAALKKKKFYPCLETKPIRPVAMTYDRQVWPAVTVSTCCVLQAVADVGRQREAPRIRGDRAVRRRVRPASVTHFLVWP